MKTQKGIRSNIYEILKNSNKPLTVDEIISELQKLITLKKPKQQVRNALTSSDSKRILFIRVDSQKYDLIERVVKDNYYRYTLTNFDIKNGILPCDDELHFIFDLYWQEEKRCLKFYNLNGNVIAESKVTYTGTMPPRRRIYNFKDWFAEEKVGAGDDILIKIIDLIDGKYGLKSEKKNCRNENLIQKKNMEVAEIMVGVLDKIDAKGTWPSELLLRVSGLYSYKDSCPPDQLIKIAHLDKRFLIYQYDLISLTEIFLAEKVKRGPFGRPVPKTSWKFAFDSFEDTEDDDIIIPPSGFMH